MQYKIKKVDHHTLYFAVECILKTDSNSSILLQLPAWRPGRYQIQNFAKYLKNISAVNEKQEPLAIKKTKKDTWLLASGLSQEVTITYEFYAAMANAGGSYIKKDFLYVNPVNCLMYVPGREDEPCQLSVFFEFNQYVACGMPYAVDGEKVIFKADNYHQMVDSPFFIAKHLHHCCYELNNTPFHFWAYGHVAFDWERITKDFAMFTQSQIEVFGEFPEKEYHFMLWGLPEAYYHGVEHANSTMMVLGPETQNFEELYLDLLGLASHELFHTWNVKSIRPKELLPYNYSQENYFSTCFVAEGVTTFYGDLMLYEAGVYSQTQYFKELETLCRRHFETAENAALSLLESSFDLWLDGYEKTAPNRAVSVYHKGALAAFILHQKILHKTNGVASLHTVMKRMYERFGQRNIGYSYDDYQKVCEEVYGESLAEYFENIIEGTNSIWDDVNQALDYINLGIIKNTKGNVLLINKS